MFERQFLSGRFRSGRGIRLVLIFTMLFALWHVSQHNVQSDIGEHCNVCRLNHTPSAGGPAQVLFAATFTRAAPLVAAQVPHLRSKSYLPRFARGPPSF